MPIGLATTIARIASTERASAATFTDRSACGSRVRPPGTSTDCARSAATTSAGVRPYPLSSCGSGTTVISRLRPPMSSTAPTPWICCSAGFTTSSATFVSRSTGSAAENARVATGIAPMSSFCTTGVWISRGSLESVACTRSRTSWAAMSAFRSRSKRMMICETFSRFIDRSVSSPGSVLNASSNGFVTVRSIASGSAPGRTVVTVTNGNSTSGYWSTPMRG